MIAVLDYGTGNIHSAQKALTHLGANAALVTSPEGGAQATGVVLPGVGAFGACVAALRSSGLDRVALDAIDAGLPFLGICVGLQMLYESSEEDPSARGLAVLPGKVGALPADQKRPQMQWNRIEVRAPSVLLAGLGEGAWMYFVHSYAPERTAETVAVCDYGGPVVAAVERDNVWGTQFHAEKSGRAGLAVLANFLKACGEA